MKFDRQGFTLIDMLITVMILGVLSMVAVPQFHSMVTEEKLNAAAEELVSALLYAGNLAVNYQRPFGLEADANDNWFRVFDNRYKADSDPHHDAVPPVDANGVVLNPFDKKWYLKDFGTLKTYEGVKITAVPAGGEIRFYPDGHSASSDSTFVLSYAGRQRTITVNGATGRVTVQ